MIKKTREELEKLPLKVLINIDIANVDEEKMIQEIIQAKTVVLPSTIKFNKIVPDIKTLEDEARWQGEINKFNDSLKPIEIKVKEATIELETIKNEINSETVVEKIEPEVITVEHTDINKPFCDKCTSKGVRHKKECPLYVPNIKKDEQESSN